MGETQFLQLLVSQMQNQDPMSPMDGTQMASQLAQFSSVEQLMDINTKIDSITSIMKAQGATTSGTSSDNQRSEQHDEQFDQAARATIHRRRLRKPVTQCQRR